MRIPRQLGAAIFALLLLTSCTAPHNVAVEETYEPFPLSGDFENAADAP